MAWLTFGTATSPEPMSALDTQFNNVASGMELPCTATGTNAISLTPLTNFPSLSSYNELGGYRFVAANSSTGAVTLQYNGLGFLPVYHADGVTQATIGDIIINQQYIVTFHQALNSGGGGFFFLSASTPTTTASWNQPGGRLTIQSATPVMFTNQTSKQIIYYAPYQHPFVPLYNGSIIQNYQFTSSQSDQVGLQLNMGGAANFTTNLNFDIFAFLSGGVPTLVATAWTNNTTRATSLSVFGGFLTNAGSMTAQTGPNTSTTVPINQGTFLGTVQTSAQGTTQWVFGGSGTGGTAASFNVGNYYNPVLFTTSVNDTGTVYTYTGGVVRDARGAGTMHINFVQPSSERAILVLYQQRISIVSATGADGAIFIGVNSTTAGVGPSALLVRSSAATGDDIACVATTLLSFTGFGFVAALETSDGTNANSFNASSTSAIFAQLWL